MAELGGAGRGGEQSHTDPDFKVGKDSCRIADMDWEASLGEDLRIRS